MSFIHFFVYISLAFFLIMIILRAVKIAKTPVHLRWELYPVPHEKGKSSYGGSRMEEFEWWKKESKKDIVQEFAVMAEEIFLLKAVWKNNKKLWFGSFPLHLGLYLAIVAGLIGFALGILDISGAIEATFLSTGLGIIVAYIINIIVYGASTAGIAGAIILFCLRSFDKGLRKYSSMSHYFHILLLGSIFVSLFIWINSSVSFGSELQRNFANIFSGSPLFLSEAETINIYVTAFFLLYLPLTHMTHFFMKYFTYHRVRWDDEPNDKNSDMHSRIQKQLNYPVSWAAPHIGADGGKTWIAVASHGPKEKKK